MSDMSDFTEYDEGTFGFEVERVRREGIEIADQLERDGHLAAALWLRAYFNQRADEAMKNMATVRDDSLRSLGLIR